ncbi:MAG: class I SAM-dependent RNA methyltransferase [Variibacter sp.]
MTEQLTITRMGHRGDGVAEGGSEPLFVAYTLPGETVTVAAVPGHGDRRELLRVDRASDERIAPICQHFGTCGGCAVQHWRHERYAAWKRDLVIAALAQAGLAADVEDLVDAHGEGRRRVVLHARQNRDILQVGFAAPRAHHIVPIDRCPILAPALDGVIPLAWALAEPLQPLRKPLDIHVTATDTGLDVDIRGSGPLTPSLEMQLGRVAIRRNLARLTRHGELVMQRAAPTLRMGSADVALPPGPFLQPTADGEAALARLVLGHVQGAKRVLDLFAGVGPFSLRMAEDTRVTAIDGAAAAVDALKHAAGNARGLKPVDTQVRDLFRRPLLPAELAAFDAAVVDPPRQGAEAQTRHLAASKIKRVVAVSCNPATFARDARLLVDGGFALQQVTPVDQFRYSAHVEIVALFAR